MKTKIITLILGFLIPLSSFAQLTVNASVTSNYNGAQISCFGSNDGQAIATASNGVAPYTYVWSTAPMQTTQTATGLAAGVYSVTVTDNAATTATATVTITEPPVVSVSINTSINVTCNGGADGTLVATAFGGQIPPSYTFLWSNGQISQTATGLTAGTHCVTVSDGNGCAASICGNISQPPPITANIVAQTNVDCFGSATGSVMAAVTGGTAGYTFLWGGGTGFQTTQTATGLAAGTYCATVTDANGCTASTCVTITQPAAPVTAAITIISNTTSGNCIGEAQFVPFGGTAPYTFLWSNASASTTQNISGLCVGFYTATVVDVMGCVAVANAIITDSASVIASAVVISNYNGAQISCNGASDGQIQVTAVGGTAPYSYLWSGGQNTAIVNSMPAGTYSVTVTDNVGATATASIVLNQPPTVVAAATNLNNVDCFGGATGLAMVSATGGTGAYTFFWNAATGNQTTAIASGLATGSYCVTATDINGCQANTCAVITEPTLLVATATLVSPSTLGGCNGTAQATASGGISPYLFQWSNGVTSTAANGLCQGNYTVTVTDMNGCTTTDNVVVYDSTFFSTIISPVSNYNGAYISCNGASDGALAANVFAGTAPYTYLWAGGQTSAQISGLATGSYSVTVSDALGATATNSYTLLEPNSLLIAATASGSYCTVPGSGQMTGAATGGTSPYTYLWNTGANTQIINNLQAGNYTVSVSDANGCTASSSGIIHPHFLLSHTVLNASCLGNDGVVNLTLSQGNYNFLWSNGATTEDLSGLIPGTYQVQINNNAGCIVNQFVVVSGGINGSVFASYTHASCQNNNGAINQTVTNFNNPQFLWSNGATTEDISGLAAGSYACTISDGTLGCTVVRNYYIYNNFNCNIHISGYVRNVVNTGLCSYSGSLAVPQTMVRLQPLGLTTFTTFSGYYTFNTQIPGNYTIELVNPGLAATQLCPSANISINNAQQGSYYNNNNFYLMDSLTVNVSVDALVQGFMRAGYASNFRLYICNTGAMPQSDTVAYHYDSNLSFVGFQYAYNIPAGLSYWDDTTNHILYLYYQNLQPGYCQYIYMQFLLSQSLANGTMICNQAYIGPLAEDNNPVNNYDEICFVVGNSYDPNDKQVSPLRYGDEYSGGIIFEQDNTLKYLIRFQNVGAAPAYRVVIRDTLDVGLNPETINNIQMSHNGQLELIDGHILVCTFDSIELPHMAFDTVGSNGFLSFSIDRMPGQSLGTTINNQAHIYFDFNPAIVTNMTTVMLGLPNGVQEMKMTTEPDFQLFPNPSSGQFSIALSDAQGMVEISIYNALGQLLKQEQHSAQSLIAVDFEATPGIYFVQLRNDSGVVGVRKLRIK